MAITMMHNNDIDKTKYFTDEEKTEMKKANEGKTVCPIMSGETIKYSGSYAVCVKELCALWNGDRCGLYPFIPKPAYIHEGWCKNGE